MWKTDPFKVDVQGRAGLRPRRRGQPAGPRRLGLRRPRLPRDGHRARAHRQAPLRRRRGSGLGLRHPVPPQDAEALPQGRPHRHPRRRQRRRHRDRGGREEHLLAQGHHQGQADATARCPTRAPTPSSPPATSPSASTPSRRRSSPPAIPSSSPTARTLSPTKKEANVPNVNTIPGDDVFYVDMRILPCYPVDDGPRRGREGDARGREGVRREDELRDRAAQRVQGHRPPTRPS